MKKRLFALFLCLCMVMTLLPVGAFAEGTEAKFGLADGGASVTSVNPVETPDTHITFKFYNGETLLDTQVVNGDGQLTAPATPAIEGGRKFLGWYAVDASGQLEAQEFDFSNAYTNYSGRSEVKVMAKFEAVFYVYFMTVDGQVHSTAIANAANDFKVALPTDYEPNGKVVTGWKANGAVFTADTVVSADTYVYPDTADCYWVTFNTTGGSMVASCSIKMGDTLELSTVTRPTRTGYRFKGWSTTEGGALISSVTPTADTTLYAVWEGDNVTYTVVYWGENPNNTATENIPFDTLLGTESKTAKVGTTVTGSASTASNNTIKNYFTYHSSDSAVVKADNSTVINVYYTRKPFSVTFDLGNSYFNSVSMTVGGKTYTNGRNADKYVLTAKYEQNIESLWPTASNFSSGSNFSGWSVDGLDGTATSKRVTMTADLCSSSGKTAKANYDASCLDHLYYMFESFDQTSPANGNERKQYGNVYYDKSDAYSQDANSGGGKWGQKEITGMTASGKHTDVIDSTWFDPTERNVFLYYTRNEYDFIKNNYGTVASEKVKFGASLADKGGEPARPAGFSENAVFKGWYEVPVGQITDSTLPYDFTGKTMPASKLTLFAYWVEKPVTLTVQVPTLGGYTASNYEVAIGTVISGVDVFKDAEAAIEAAGKTVLKWVYDDGTAVDVNSAIGSDTIVKAVLEGEVYTLTYVTGTDAAITDENRYEYEALAQVKDGSGLKSGDKVFACWTDETGKVYYPGSYVTMTGNKTLTANYVDPSVKVTLTYHSNFDTDQTKTIDAVPNNDKVSVMDYTSTGLSSRPGYQVKGWKDANGVEYAVGSEARLDNNGSNDLYAVWEAIDVDYTVEFYYQNTDGTYPDKAKDENIVTRQGKTDSIVSVTAADKADKKNGKYVYDESYNGNIESGTVTANGSLVLKLYFKLNQASCTVRYLWNGTDEKVAKDDVFDSQTVSETFTANPKPIANCTIVPEHDVTKSITVDPDSDNNVITFYYYKNVTLTANSDTLEYDGKEHSVSGFNGAPEDADFSAITVGAKGTDAGVYPAEFANGTVGKTDAAKKYIVTEANNGSLTISPISTVITITANSKTREYNGEALTDNGCTFTQGVLVDGDVLQAVVEGSQTDKGSSANVVKSYKVVRGSDDVTGNYKFANSVDGTLTVTPRVVVIESEGGRRVYNGQPLTNPTYKFTTGSFVDGEVSEVKTTGTITEVGSVDNTIVYTTTDKFDANNYDITLTPGKLEITPVTAEVVVTITENSGSAKYDGTEKTVTGYVVTSISDPLYKESDFTFSGDATIKGTDAGTYDMNLAPENFTNINGNFKNVRFVINDGTLVISPRTLAITSGSDSKEYNGTPLTSSEIKVSGDGFVGGEGASYTFTGSQLDVGSSKNTFDYELNANTKAKNYEITKEYGDLTVTAVSTQIVITANSDSKVYDGQPLTNGNYTYTGKLAEGDKLEVEVVGSQTDKGSSDNVVKSYKVTRDGVDVTNNYTFGASQKGTLTVTPRPVTLTSGGGEKEYDGTPLTNSTVTVGGSGFVADEGATYNVTGSQTDKGSSKNWFTYTLAEGTKADNYTITQEYGELVVTKNTSVINITAKSANKTYDGQALTETRYDFTQNILAEGDVLTAVVEGSQTDAGSSANVVKSYKVMRGDVDVTDFYTFGEIENGTLTVTERKVTLTSESADKPYDGTPLTSPDVTVSDEGFVDGEVSDIKAIGTITDKGSVPNTITFTEGENFKASNYIIVRETGTLTITADATEVVVYISGNTGTEKYDGTEKTVTGYKVTSISSGLYKESDFAFTGNATVSATDARATSYPMGLTAGNFENKNDNFSKVTFVVTDGSLTIDPRTVTLTSESATKEYNGTPLTRPDVTVSGDGFVEGEVSGIKATGSITYYGEVDNDIKYTKEAGYKDSNYIVTPEIGKLGITRSSKELKVVANSGTWEYDGKVHADGGYTVTFGEESYTVAAGESAKLSTGDTVTAIITKQVKNVADSADRNNAIVTLTIDNAAQYANVSQANGTLTITAKPLTITADSAEKVYDGQPLTKNSFTNTELAEGDKLTATVTGSQTNVGSSDNVASAAVIMAGEENVTANYTITYEKGSLTVTPVTDEVIVTVTERGGDYLYDGGEKVVTGYDAVSSNPLYTANDYSFSGDATVKSTNAGSYDMELAPEDFKNTSTNFTNVTFIIVDGKLNIAQRKVLMTSADDEKVYDGTPLTNSTVTVTGDGFAEGEGAAYTVTGSQLDEGSSNNSFTYELNEGTLAANYIIETKEGELTVKPILTEITITANSGEKMYDGSALINGGYTFTSGILVDGDVLTAVVEGSQLNAGSSANVVKSYRVMRGETDVTANYRFAESVDGKLTVTARKVVMTSADDEKVYDGTPLTNDEITVTGDGFIEGEGVTYDVTGSQLDVGSSDNSFTYELNEGTLAENYIIETEEGKLTVTSPEQHIVITANSAEKTYDGTPLTDDGFTYTDFVLAEGDVLEAVVEGSQTDAGSSVNVIKSYRVMRGDEDVTANYIFDDSVDGTLTVTKRKVTLTSGTACKIYDGKYLTCNKVEVGGDGFVEGEGATYDVTGKRKDIGWSYNDFTYKLNDNTKADNYEITVERGILYVKDQAEKPKTGDSSDLLLLLALMSMSGAGAAGTVYLYRRKREEQE